MNENHIHNELFQGTGFLPTLNLGFEKGYTFFLHTGNMIFIRNDLVDLLPVEYQSPTENFRRDWTGYI